MQAARSHGNLTFVLIQMNTNNMHLMPLPNLCQLCARWEPRSERFVLRPGPAPSPGRGLTMGPPWVTEIRHPAAAGGGLRSVGAQRQQRSLNCSLSVVERRLFQR